MSLIFKFSFTGPVTSSSHVFTNSESTKPDFYPVFWFVLNIFYLTIKIDQACCPWGCRGCHILADRLTLSRGGRLCPSNNTGTPGFSDLPTALLSFVCRESKERDLLHIRLNFWVCTEESMSISNWGQKVEEKTLPELKKTRPKQLINWKL